jgi:hypothetical protein
MKSPSIAIHHRNQGDLSKLWDKTPPLPELGEGGEGKSLLKNNTDQNN